MKIFLVGMPGSGKSTLGEQVADALDMPFFDLDQEIETREGRTIPQIFAESGEDHFRLLESTNLREFAGRETSFVLATGGGAPCFFENMEVLNSSGITVYLDVAVSTLAERLRHNKGRPLLEGNADREARLAQLLESRKSVYERARLIVKQPDADKVVQAILGVNINR